MIEVTEAATEAREGGEDTEGGGGSGILDTGLHNPRGGASGSYSPASPNSVVTVPTTPNKPPGSPARINWKHSKCPFYFHFGCALVIVCVQFKGLAMLIGILLKFKSFALLHIK